MRQVPEEESDRPAEVGGPTIVAARWEMGGRRGRTSRQAAGAPIGAGGARTEIGLGGPAGWSAEEARPRVVRLGLGGAGVQLFRSHGSLDEGCMQAAVSRERAARLEGPFERRAL